MLTVLLLKPGMISVRFMSFIAIPSVRALPGGQSNCLHGRRRQELLLQEVADIVECLPLMPSGEPGSYASRSSSVRYLGASAFTFSMNAASSFSPSFGGGVVRVTTGTPTSMKNLSCPAGEQMQSTRTGPVEVLWN